MKIKNVALVIVCSLNTFANECLDLYRNKEIELHLGAASTRVIELLAASPEEISNAHLVLLNATPKKTADESLKKQLSSDWQSASISQKNAYTWAKALVDSKFIFGPFHQLGFLFSMDPEFFSQTHKFHKRLAQYSKNEFAALMTVYDAEPGSLNFARREGLIRKQLDAISRHAGRWENLDEPSRVKHYNEYIGNFESYALSQKKYFEQMNILAGILSTAEGKAFLYLVLDKTSSRMTKILMRERGFMGNTIAALSAIGASIATPIIDTNGATILSGAIGIMGTFVIALANLDSNQWFKSGALNRSTGYFLRKSGRKQLLADSELNMNANKERIAAEQVKQLEEVSSDFETLLAGAKEELALPILTNHFLFPVWGQKYNEIFQSLIHRTENIKRRYELTIGDSAQVLANLTKENLTLDTVKANDRINQISRDSLFRLLLDVQALRADIISTSLALDQYYAKLDETIHSPLFANLNMRSVVDQKKASLDASVKGLLSLIQIVATKNQVLIHDFSILSQIDQVTATERLLKLAH